MATEILKDKKSTHGSPFAYYSVSVEEVSRTPTTVKLKVTATGKLQYSSSWLGTGTGYGLVAWLWVGGAWHSWTLKSSDTTWSGTTKHSKSKTIEVPAAADVSELYAEFCVERSSTSYTAASLKSTTCKNIPITNVAEMYNDVTIEGEAGSQAQATSKLSGLPSAAGYDSVICWYKGGALVGTTSIPANSTVTEHMYTFDGLLPSASYDLMAEVREESATGALLVAKSVTLSTPAETGILKLTPKATYIGVDVSGMFENPNYTRNIEVYYKKSVESTFTKAATLTEQGSSALVNITGLTSNESYDVKVNVVSGTTVLLSMTDTVVTEVDTSLIPMGIISSIKQKIGTRECTVEWTVDKSVASTVYDFQARVEGESEWVSLLVMSEVISPAVIVAPDGNVNIDFRIVSTNYALVDEIPNISEKYTVYIRDDFEWDTPKVSGEPFVVTAAEWNRLRDYVIAKNADMGITLDIPPVRPGGAFTADIFNTMRRGVDNICVTGITDVRPGDAIQASYLHVLGVLVNTVSA